MNRHHPNGAGLVGLATMSLLGSASPAAPPTFTPDRTLVLREWVVLGPIAAPQRMNDGADYLTSLGGEAAATLTDGAAVTLRDGTGNEISLAARRATSDESGVLDIGRLFPGQTNAIAYAYTEFQSGRAGEAAAFLGSDDWAKVWVNGQAVYSRSGPGGRGLRPREDAFPIPLKKGRNTVLLKVDQADGAWSAILEIAPKEELERIVAREREMRKVRRFQRLEVGPREEWRWVFEPGPFPEIAWKDPDLAAESWGDAPLKVRWFDAGLNEVTTATKPGRYAAYIEAAGRDGQVARRALTFYCTQGMPALYTDPPTLTVPHLPLGGIDPAVWTEYQPVFGRLMGRDLFRLLAMTETGPVWLAGLSEAKPLGRAPTQVDNPETAHLDYHLRLKQKILGTEGKYKPLAMPRKKAGDPATTLRTGTLAQAGMKADAPERIRAACQEWNKATGIPFSVLVARHGVIAFHEAFGGPPEKAVTVAQKYPLASLTKTHTGLMFAQFIDQGLISLDDPVGKYLPGFATEGKNVLTLRHCLTCTSGLEGHGEFGGMMNPWLDSVIANGMGIMEPGKTYIYNGMGYDLAGKVMEVVSGKSIFRLMHENFFRPLGQEEPTMEDMAYGIDCTVADLARVGQLMLNRGSYGDTEFFSAETFERQVRPRPLKVFFPEITNERENAYNMGMHYAKDGDPENPILGKNTLMHGAASGAILRVDYDHDLVVALGRPDPGPDYDRHAQAFLRAVAESLE